MWKFVGCLMTYFRGLYEVFGSESFNYKHGCGFSAWYKSVLYCGVLSLILISQVNAEEYATSDRNIDIGGLKMCTSTAGTEIKDYRTFEAPRGLLFNHIWFGEESSDSNHGLHGETGCFIVEEKHAPPPYSKGIVSVTVLAHADCGSGPGNLGKFISVNCVFSAKITFPSSDLIPPTMQNSNCKWGSPNCGCIPTINCLGD